MDHRACLELAEAASVVPVVLGPALAMGNLDAVIPVVSIPVLDAPAPGAGVPLLIFSVQPLPK